jgi:photosystem II stability/assembly factor-like uncharacterized protein
VAAALACACSLLALVTTGTAGALPSAGATTESPPPGTGGAGAPPPAAVASESPLPAPGAAGAPPAAEPPGLPSPSDAGGDRTGAAAATAVGPPPFPAPLGTALRWRLIGPYRGGRVLAVSGVPGRPETFYFGAVGGGVWRSDDAGRVWTPVFDGPPSGSIGALAVAPSNPDVIYVGTGEADMRSDVSWGDGMYRSSDGGRSFQPIGLRDSRQIGRILVDPRDPDVALVAALGHGFGPNPERGVFRTADGGRSWQRVLYRDDTTGAIDLAAGPADPQTVYAALWNVRRPPWSTYAPLGGPGSGLFRSSDGGLTWQELTGHGLPAGPPGRIGLAVAAGSAAPAAGEPGQPRPPGEGRGRVYALIDALIDSPSDSPRDAPSEAGLYRSDDGGGSWRRVCADRRLTSRSWYFSGVIADPRDADTVYVSNVALYRSRDGGQTFQAIKGAPGGDDYHSLWIDPGDPRRMILGSDQGAAVSVDGAATWSSWFNQPTAQIYHVATDDRFPYTIYGAQQDSGTVAVSSRSDFGQISFRDWFSTGTGESGYILPDPTDPDAVYGGNPGGQLFRFSRRTNQVQDVSPTPGPKAGASGNGVVYRYPWTPALAISPLAPHAIYQGSQFVHRSTDRGMSWTVISPDLTLRKARHGAAGARAEDARGGQGRGRAGKADVSPDASSREPGSGDARSGRTGNGKPSRGRREAGGATARGAASGGPQDSGQDKAVIYAIASSPLRAGQLWVGTDNGLVQLTLDDGPSWRDVTPPGLAEWSMVSTIEASRWEAGAAYLAIDRHLVDDLRPYALRTRDFGHTWTPIVAGIAATAHVHAVREDPGRRGLLYAATETGVYVSFDDGDRWQPLQLNLPAVSVRDLAVHGEDLIAATHGRSFWVLDGLTPLRQLDTAVVGSPAHLFSPAPAIRRRRGENRETPLPPETPAGANPPTGALVDYWLDGGSAAAGAGTSEAAGATASPGTADATGPPGPAGEVTLEIFDPRGELVRRFASDDPVPRPEELGAHMPLAPSWLRPAPPLGKRAGLNRFTWDLRYPAPPVLRPQASMDAVHGEPTPLEPEGPLVLPGLYRLKLTAGGSSSTATLRVDLDPRVTVSPEALASQLDLSRRIDAALAMSYLAVQQLRALAERLEHLAAAEPQGPQEPPGTSGPGTRPAPAPAAPPASPPGPAAETSPGPAPVSRPSAPAQPPATPSSPAPSTQRAPSGDLARDLVSLREKVRKLAGHEAEFEVPPEKEPGFAAIHTGIAALAVAVGTGDAAPTAQAAAAFAAYRAQLDRALAAWAVLRTSDLPALDRRLAAEGLPAIEPRP